MAGIKAARAGGTKKATARRQGKRTSGSKPVEECECEAGTAAVHKETAEEVAKVEPEGMESEYEVQRLLNIKRNQAIMDTLGIGSTLQVVNAFNTAPKPVRPSACKRKRTTPDPTTIPPRKMPRRESGRLAGIKPIELELPEEVDMKEERRLWEEEELIFQAKKNQKGAKHVGGVRSRPSPLPTYLDLLHHKALSYGERVFSTQRKGKRFYGDLEVDGSIRYSAGQKPELDLTFPSPTAFNNFCGKLADPSYFKGNGFNYVFHKPPGSGGFWMPLDYYRWKAFGRSEKSYPKGFTPASHHSESGL